MELLLTNEKKVEHFVDSPALDMMGKLMANEPGVTDCGAQNWLAVKFPIIAFWRSWVAVAWASSIRPRTPCSVASSP